jgi:hypothetical protein
VVSPRKVRGVADEHLLDGLGQRRPDPGPDRDLVHEVLGCLCKFAFFEEGDHGAGVGQEVVEEGLGRRVLSEKPYEWRFVGGDVLDQVRVLRSECDADACPAGVPHEAGRRQIEVSYEGGEVLHAIVNGALKSVVDGLLRHAAIVRLPPSKHHATVAAGGMFFIACPTRTRSGDILS